VRPLVLSLRARPSERLDLSALVPQHLIGKTAAEIAAVQVNTTKYPVRTGDAFRVRMGDVRTIRIEGGSDRLDRVGRDMSEGEIVVEGEVGVEAGRLMTGGRLRITGNAGPFTASGMRGGEIEIAGHAGERLGGPLCGEMAGMRGGIVVVRGNAGDRVGDRMRRGTIIVEGGGGAQPGSRMIAGTLVLCGRSGTLPGYLMRRGTIVLGAGSEELSPTFADSGSYDLVAVRLMGQFMARYSRGAALVLRARLRRFSGDLAVLGKGELFVVEPA
jgi:formylmethanofuran dehydrogenase subunit C